MKLSVVDQSPICEGRTAADALQETIALAKATEALGYHRYWVAEHHNTVAFAGSAPEIMVARLAAETTRIRVGSGGVMMMHYAPYKIAEQFRMLHTLSPGRIDLGVGRAPGGDMKAIAALQPGPERYGSHVYPQQIQLLKDLLTDASGETPMPANHPFAGIRARPCGPGSPEIWLLGSGPDSAEVAGITGQRLAYAHFIVGDQGSDGTGGPETMMHYRRRFQPSVGCPAPQALLAVAAIVAETEEEAQHQASSVRYWAAQVGQGQSIEFPTPEKAQAHTYSDREETILRDRAQRAFVGTPDKVRDQLLAKAEDYGADELMIVTITHDPAARLRSYELLADAFGVTP